MDYVPNSVMKSAADVFGHITSNLVNLSFAEGLFSTSFKAGQVATLLKKPGPSMENMSNYRPFTNLNTIGKILERLAMKQIRRHVENSPNLGPL